MNEVLSPKVGTKRGRQGIDQNKYNMASVSRNLCSPGKLPIITIIIIIVIPLVCTTVKLRNNSGIQGLCLHKVPSCKLLKSAPFRWINYRSLPLSSQPTSEGVPHLYHRTPKIISEQLFSHFSQGWWLASSILDVWQVS